MGLSPDEAARKLAELDIDVVGVNCSTGPAQVLRLIAMIHQAIPDLLLSAAPNAGWPEQLDGGTGDVSRTARLFWRICSFLCGCRSAVDRRLLWHYGGPHPRHAHGPG
ncbi:MAG: homocysteine S-methyltransferase family protein [Chloroflexi bacterium]|nr:homocysteine S-methyltransferase family protein [Chloroflexota bacterium]